ncbi:MAG: 30S ribosomal protein S3 [Candidatus Abawacabacteria bacterium RIFCSPHIGHO2_01_FULL_46_8]|uniref:Small ribosomal subunit protein uS3 n=1 Tax=Candidatus Abawacabacteria bacterium RIFCSPHIGHO2_01_FULL_46_8 TaxID=1817815 RepID=A0A1F4XMR6_9BACT|nr:ribosomal protein S3 [uncultured bacterium]OGC82936.1 MAG: 30S ribosomal protein S3 [Candidatus Abawacabacteria bacterium RIFCSPHIGHO2_01_FULL_46_8]
MGQKVNPYSFRLGINKPWISRWFQQKDADYVKTLHKDFKVRAFIEQSIEDGGIALIEIARPRGKTEVVIHTSKPGVVIGKSGMAIEDLRLALEKKFQEVFDVKVQEIRKPELSAILLAEVVAKQIEKRMPYRRAVKQAVTRCTELGAKGVKILVKGRLNGAEIARQEMFSHGKVPLHTIRADIDYASRAARTSYGAIGVKVWIYRGEIFSGEEAIRFEGA